MSKVDEEIHAAGQSGEPPGAQAAPGVRTLLDVWELITGSEAGPWSDRLVQKWLDSDARLALFQTCVAGRDRVLSSAEEATIEVGGLVCLSEVDTGPDGCCRQAGPDARAGAVKQALVMRGKLCTALWLEASDSEQLSFTLGVLEEGTMWLDSLGVECDEPVPASTMAVMGRRCPNLGLLRIIAPFPELPHPKSFPELEDLFVSDAPPSPLSGPTDAARRQLRSAHTESVCHSAAAYIKQLTRLTLCLTTIDPYLPLLLSPGNVGRHLHTLSLGITLDDTALGLILQCAPAVEEVDVTHVKLQSDALVHPRHHWKQLEFSCSLCLSSLARLPVAPGLVLAATSATTNFICDVTGMDEAAAARLENVRFRCGDNCLNLDLNRREASPANQPAALRVALNLLRSCPVDDGSGAPPRVRLYGFWTFSHELLAELQGLPRWTQLEFNRLSIWLPGQPQLYEPLLRLLPDSYCQVSISCGIVIREGRALTPEQVTSICLGAPVNRTAQAPLFITLKQCPDELLQDIQQRMQLGSFPNVVVLQG